MDMQLEVVVLPVSDVDRAKDFYEQAGFRLDTDHRAGDDFRVVQVTPPGSHCSVSFGVGVSQATPGSIQGLHLVVADLPTVLDELVGPGRRGERAVPLRPRRPGARGRSRAPGLCVLRRLPRPRRQRLAAPGGPPTGAGALTRPGPAGEAGPRQAQPTSLK